MEWVNGQSSLLPEAFLAVASPVPDERVDVVEELGTHLKVFFYFKTSLLAHT